MGSMKESLAEIDILCIPDLHFPFHHKKALDYIFKEFIEKIKFTHIIQLGDLLDAYSFSKFAKKNLFMSHRELKDGREAAVDMWNKISLLQPQAKLIQLLGNHDDRMMKRTQERLPEAQELIKYSLDELYTFDGVHTVYDSRQEYFINDICFHHGYLTKMGEHSKYILGKFVHGHTHRGGSVYYPIKGKNIWELDCGHLADYRQEPMRYRPQKITNSNLGFGKIDKYGPRFIHIDMDSDFVERVEPILPDRQLVFPDVE